MIQRLSTLASTIWRRLRRRKPALQRYTPAWPGAAVLIKPLDRDDVQQPRTRPGRRRWMSREARPRW